MCGHFVAKPSTGPSRFGARPCKRENFTLETDSFADAKRRMHTREWSWRGERIPSFLARSRFVSSGHRSAVEHATFGSQCHHPTTLWRSEMW